MGRAPHQDRGRSGANAEPETDPVQTIRVSSRG